MSPSLPPSRPPPLRPLLTGMLPRGRVLDGGKCDAERKIKSPVTEFCVLDQCAVVRQVLREVRGECEKQERNLLHEEEKNR